MSRPYCFTVPTTPTIVIGCLGSRQRCLPSGSWPGQKRCANFSSTMTTGCAFGIVSNVREEPALQQGNLQCPEIVRRGGALIHLQFLPGLRGEAFNIDRAPADRRRERQRRDGTSHLHARHGGDLVADLAEELDRGLAVRKLPAAGPEAHGDHVVGVESRRHILQAHEAANEQARRRSEA